MLKIFGYQHIIYLAVTLIATAAIIVFIKWKSNKEKLKGTDDKFLRTVALISGLVLLAAIVTNRISLAVYREKPIELIPNTFCGATSFFFSLVLIFGKRNNKALQFIALVAVFSGTASIFYPDFIGQNESFFYLPTISGLFHHSMQVYCWLMVL